MPAGERTDGRWAWPFTAGLLVCARLAQQRLGGSLVLTALRPRAKPCPRGGSGGGDAGCTENHWAPRLVPEVVLTEPATPRDWHVSRSEPEAE